MGRSTQPLNQLLSEQHPFILYRFPKSSVLHYMRIGTTTILDSALTKLTRNGFIFAPFKASFAHPVCLFEPELMLDFSVDEPFSMNPKLLFTTDSDFKTVSREKYGRKFQQFIQQLEQNSNLKKLVLARKFFLGSETLPDPGIIIGKLNKAFPNSFLFLINHPNIGVWCGATPENLLNIEGTKGKTVALAGTQKIEELSPLAWSGKEIEEQHLVEVFIEEKLTEVVGKFEKEGPHTVFTGNLAHLSTSYRFEIGNDLPVSLLKSLHPTPAVCGLPKTESQKIIGETEGFDREYYAGYLGPVSPDSSAYTDLYVTLRCFKICKQGFEFFIGGGITPQSIEEKEWIETENKLESLLPFIG